MCKRENCREPTVQRGELCSGLCGELNGKEIQKSGISVCVQLTYFVVQQKLTQHSSPGKESLLFKEKHTNEAGCSGMNI